MAGHLVDVFRLPAHRDSGQPWQIDECQIGAAGRVHVQDDGLIDDLLVLPAYFVGQFLDGILDLEEIGELLAGQFLKEGMRALESVIIDHPYLKRPPRDHTLNKH